MAHRLSCSAAHGIFLDQGSTHISCIGRQILYHPAPLVKEIVFNPLYIPASFVKDKVPICVWIYLWVFYFVPLIYISVFHNFNNKTDSHATHSSILAWRIPGTEEPGGLPSVGTQELDTTKVT